MDEGIPIILAGGVAVILMKLSLNFSVIFLIFILKVHGKNGDSGERFFLGTFRIFLQCNASHLKCISVNIPFIDKNK